MSTTFHAPEFIDGHPTHQIVTEATTVGFAIQHLGELLRDREVTCDYENLSHSQWEAIQIAISYMGRGLAYGPLATLANVLIDQKEREDSEVSQ